MKQKRQRVYRERQPGKRIPGRTSTGIEAVLDYAAGPLPKKGEAYREWLELLHYLAKHPRNR